MGVTFVLKMAPFTSVKCICVLANEGSATCFVLLWMKELLSMA
jgi:hypothetical protein